MLSLNNWEHFWQLNKKLESEHDAGSKKGNVSHFFSARSDWATTRSTRAKLWSAECAGKAAFFEAGGNCSGRAPVEQWYLHARTNAHTRTHANTCRRPGSWFTAGDGTTIGGRTLCDSDVTRRWMGISDVVGPRGNDYTKGWGRRWWRSASRDRWWLMA